MQRVCRFACPLLLLILLPALAYSQASYTWSLKVPGGGLGNSLAVNPINANIVYGSPNTNVLWISRDRGHTWSQLGVVAGGGGITATAVCPLDTNLIVVGQKGSGGADRVVRSTDHGRTWTVTLTGSFSYWGVPLEHKHQHPNLIYVMIGTQFYKSTDFGATWILVSTPTQFNAWCDAEVNPIDPTMIWVGDNTRGIFKSTDGGVTWAQKHATGGEIPMMAVSPSNPNIIYATRWGGGNGIIKSTDFGETWTQLPQLTGSMWSIAISPTDPKYVISSNFGTNMNISRDGGQTWTQTNQGISGSGFGALVVDTFRVFALHGSGIFRLNVPENVSTRNVRMVIGVNVNNGIDYNNDTPLTHPLGVWVKGGLPTLGGLGGNWTFSDTVNNTLIRLYDDGSNGDPTPGDNIWTRSITIPAGTMRGPFNYKFGAAYAGIDTVNGGVQYLNNESAPNDYHSATFDDADTVLVLPTVRWKTRGTLNPTTVIFSMDLRGGADYYTGVALAPITQSVWVKGSLPILGRMGGNWTASDTLDGTLLRLYDDGTHGDPIASDAIWTRTMEFPENTRVGTFTYKFGAAYPGVQNNNGGVAYLNNEAAPNQFHTASLMETATQLALDDIWFTRAAPVLQVTPDSLDITVPQNQAATHPLVLANAAGFGALPLTFSVHIEDPAFNDSTTVGSMDESFAGAGRDRGNIYRATGNSYLKEIKTYFNIFNGTHLSFFVYESNSRTGTYTRIFERTLASATGSNWYSSGPMHVRLVANRFYYIGTSWQGNTVYYKSADSSFQAPFPVAFGELLTGQTFTRAGFPPAATISGSTFGVTYGPYYQALVVNATHYVTVEPADGEIPAGTQQTLALSFDVSGLSVGSYYPELLIFSNDPNWPVKPVPVHMSVVPPTSVGENGILPADFALLQNYPNPFNPSTIIRYTISHPSHVVLRIYNVLGQEVAELVNSSHQPGEFGVTWNGTNRAGQNVGSGLYFYELSAIREDKVARFRGTNKMLLVR